MLSAKSVLVVEDAALIAVDIETMLDNLGAARIVIAGGGETAPPMKAGDDPLDLAIVDIRTAGTFSVDLVGELERAGIPVIFLTTDPEGNGTPPFDGPHAVVLKPFTFEDMHAAIIRLIG